MIKITIATPVWKRPAMTDAYLKHIHAHVKYAAKAGIALTVSISGSEGDTTRKKAVKYGFLYTEIANEPLGAKFNEAVIAGCGYFQPDYIMIMGSDTFILPSIWKTYADLIALGERYIGITDLYMWDWRDNRAVYWGGYQGDRFGEPIGPGRVIHKSLLPVDGRIYQDDLNRNLDASFTRKLLEKGIKATTFSAKEYLLVSCKGDENITDISLFNQDELEKVDPSIFDEVMKL
jgi:hypothetical protein